MCLWESMQSVRRYASSCLKLNNARTKKIRNKHLKRDMFQHYRWIKMRNHVHYNQFRYFFFFNTLINSHSGTRGVTRLYIFFLYVFCNCFLIRFAEVTVQDIVLRIIGFLIKFVTVFVSLIKLWSYISNLVFIYVCLYSCLGVSIGFSPLMLPIRIKINGNTA